MQVGLARRQREAYDAARVQPTLEALRRLEPLLRRWHEKARAAVAFYRLLEQEQPDLVRALVAAGTRNGGRLQFERTRKLNKQEQRLRNGAKSEVVTVLCATVPHWPAFAGRRPVSGIEQAFRTIEKARETLAAPAAPRQVAEALGAVRQARVVLEAAEQDHAGLLANFSKAWWEGVCRWANRLGLVAGTLRLEGRDLVDDLEGGAWSISLPEAAGLVSGWEAARDLLPA